MKANFLFILIFLAFFSKIEAQEINGKILINQLETYHIEFEGQEVVKLYAQLRVKDFSINFQFEGNNMPLTNDGKQVSLIQFNTIVKFNGREIANFKRNPMPFFPGSMFMPIETFELISLLTLGNDRKGSIANQKLQPGKYEVILEAKSLDATGNIKPSILKFEVK